MNFVFIYLGEECLVIIYSASDLILWTLSLLSGPGFLLFRIHFIGKTMSKDISFNSNNFFFKLFFWLQNKSIKVLVSWWSANSNLIGLNFTAYFLIFWLADFEYPALLIGLELLLRSLSLSTPLWPSWDLSGSAYWIEFFPTNQSSSNNQIPQLISHYSVFKL